LAAMLPGDLSRVFFTESGSVAVEVALKIAVQYWRNTTGKVRPKFLAFRGGYHGDTFAAMSVCDPEDSMHSLFAGALTQQHIVDLPTDAESAARMERVLADNRDIAAVINRTPYWSQQACACTMSKRCNAFALSATSTAFC